MPPVSEAQRRLMHAAAAHPGGFGGISQAVGREFASSDPGGHLPAHSRHSAGGSAARHIGDCAMPVTITRGAGSTVGVPDVPGQQHGNKLPDDEEVPHREHQGLARGGIGHFGGAPKGVIRDIKFHSGLIGGSGAGRTDRIPLSVPSESHVIPADVVSAAGQGATGHGARILEGALASHGPWGVAFPKMVKGRGPPKAPGIGHAAGLGFAEGGEPQVTPILAASGEIVVPPEDVRALGERGVESGLAKNGEDVMATGHRLIDEMIAGIRAFQIEWLRHAPDPKK